MGMTTEADRIMAALDDPPEPLDLTIDHMAIPEMILDLHPDEWRDFSLDRQTEYGAGSDEGFGLFDLAMACQSSSCSAMGDLERFFPALFPQ